MSFVVTPLCSNASELVSSLIFAAKKKKENISMTFAQVKFMVDENFSKWNNSDNFCTLHFSCMVLEPWTTLCVLAFLLRLCTSGIWSGTTLQVRKMSNDSQLFFFFHFICAPDKLQHYKLKDLPYNEKLKIFQSYSPYYKILKNSFCLRKYILN